jgi:hypothetical protein
MNSRMLWNGKPADLGSKFAEIAATQPVGVMRTLATLFIIVELPASGMPADRRWISLTPGSLSLDVSADRRVLYVHAMYASESDAVRQSIKTGLERRVIELVSGTERNTSHG